MYSQVNRRWSILQSAKARASIDLWKLSWQSRHLTWIVSHRIEIQQYQSNSRGVARMGTIDMRQSPVFLTKNEQGSIFKLERYSPPTHLDSDNSTPWKMAAAAAWTKKDGTAIPEPYRAAINCRYPHL